MSILSNRARHIQATTEADILEQGIRRVNANPYSKNNPQGIINLGTSENKLMFDVLSKKLTEPRLNIWREDMFKYSDLRCLYELRESIAKYLTKQGNAACPLDPNKMIVMNGCGSVIETLAIATCDVGDAWLSPTPCYGGVMSDSALRARIDVFPVHLYSEMTGNETRPYQLTAAKLEDSLQKAKSKGVNIRGLFLMNPQNPLGEIYSKELINDCLQFCHKYSLHIIFDEIYLTGGFKDGVQPTSILQFKPEDIPDPDRTHFIWGFSKDFAMSGMRVGMYYGFSDVVYEPIKNQCRFNQISPYLQVLLSEMLKDEDWLNNEYMVTNKRRLQESYSFVTKELKGLGVPYLDVSTGLYVYCDFRKFLKENTFAKEKELWLKFLDVGVYISPSQAFYSDDPGWFRIIFSETLEALEIGMERIKQVCSEIQLS